MRFVADPREAACPLSSGEDFSSIAGDYGTRRHAFLPAPEDFLCANQAPDVEMAERNLRYSRGCAGYRSRPAHAPTPRRKNQLPASVLSQSDECFSIAILTSWLRVLTPAF